MFHRFVCLYHHIDILYITKKYPLKHCQPLCLSTNRISPEFMNKKRPTLDCHPFSSFPVFSVARILTMWMVLFILTGLLAMVGSLIMPGKHAVPWCFFSSKLLPPRDGEAYFEIRCTLRKASLLLDAFVVCTNLVKVCSVPCLAKKHRSYYIYTCFMMIL